jgi:hypothetical protein
VNTISASLMKIANDIRLLGRLLFQNYVFIGNNFSRILVCALNISNTITVAPDVVLVNLSCQKMSLEAALCQ